MRKIVLVATMLLVSASAQAGGSRSLSLASNGDPVSTPQTTPATGSPAQLSEAAPTADTPKYLDRPPAVSLSVPATTPSSGAPGPTTATGAPATTPGTNTTVQTNTRTSTKTSAKADKPRHKRGWTEDRIISELHRHGIYW